MYTVEHMLLHLSCIYFLGVYLSYILYLIYNYLCVMWEYAVLSFAVLGVDEFVEHYSQCSVLNVETERGGESTGT